MKTLEQWFVRSLMGFVALVLLGGAYWGPSRLAQVLLGAGLPQSGEIVPRQIPYRGYVEQNGTPLTSAAVPMRFRLYGIDSGVLHEETQNAVVVQQGNFSVELGDGTAFGADVMRQNFLELEVGIGSPPQVLQGRQRILAVPFAQSSATGVPAGTVVPFAGEAIPAGWLLCDGATVSATQYPSLCSALGASWGAVGAGQCKLPDLRGQFLRGAHGSTLDPGGDRAVGSTQPSELSAHSHGVTDPGHAHSLNYNLALGGNWTFGGNNWNVQGGTQYNNYSVVAAVTNVSVNPAGGVETRPVNAAVQYLVKF